jgi:hypothetical protein
LLEVLYIKIILSLLAVLGLFISLGQILGRFRDKDRLGFVKAIEEQLECPKDHPGARKFISDFVHANPDYKNMKIDMTEVEKGVFVGNWLGHPNDETGRHVDSVLSGSLKLKSVHGQVTKSLCSLDDLKNWSKESPFWKWLGWGLVAASVCLGIVLLVIEEITKGA